MKKGGSDMQVNVAGLRRNLKNLAHNYSDAQKKVREATSNDPWGPSSTIMAEISDLTYNVVAFSEIMQMIWKRLNDHGKNWRHVYKALVLLEYLIMKGSEKVGHQCKENIFAIQTLKHFEYLEEGKDKGQNVRDKAKQLVNLLKDEERLRNERARALKAKERFAQSASGFGSDGGLDTPTSPKFPAFKGSEWDSSRDSVELPRELEVARPQTAGEEELQLQLALAMSREEAEQEEQKRRSDDVRLQLALSQSQQDFKTTQDKPGGAMLDLLDVNLDNAAASSVDPWGMPQPPRPQQTSNAWSSTVSASPSHRVAAPDPWAPAAAAAAAPPVVAASHPALLADPWSPKKMTTTPLVETAIRNDPWSPASQDSSDLDDFDIITNRNKAVSPDPINSNGTTTNGNNNADPFELNLLDDALPITDSLTLSEASKKTPHSFLGENSALVNLDNLVTSDSLGKSPSQLSTANPFSDLQNQRPIFNPQPPKPTMNELQQSSSAFMTSYTIVPAGPSNLYGRTPPPGGYTAGGAVGVAPSVPLIPQQQQQQQPIIDPWAPVPPTSGSPAPAAGQLGAPWMKPGYTF